MGELLRRLRDWAVGPGGWLLDSEVNDQLSAVDIELDRLERQMQTEDDCPCHGCRLDREAEKYAEDDYPA